MISFETMKILSKENIDRSLWEALVKESDTATFFQTPVCFDFYEKLPFIQAFVWGLDVEGELQAVIVGYSTKEKNCIKQFFTRRAIIIGGPLLSHNIDHRAFMDFLLQVKDSLSKENIYIEIRNFHDFSAWRQDFEHCGFEFVPHLNFHIDTRDTETVLSNMGKSRKRDVKTSLRDGAIIINNPTIAQVRDYYVILKELYTKDGGLEELFKYGYQNPVKNNMFVPVTDYFYARTKGNTGQGFYFMIPNPQKGGAMKRMCMYLRWMVRKGPVDFGIWNFMPTSDLLIPLDVHVARISRKMGLLTRNANDFKAVIELTNNLKKFDPQDPVKYDFAMFGYGVNE